MPQTVSSDSAQRALAPIPHPRESPSTNLSAKEHHQILVEWNRTDRDYPRDRTIHELFEEQVARAPEAVAALLAGEKLSYRELDLRASLVASHLRAMGVGPEALVGLRLERSFEMIIGVLGVLKAGGAYWALEENLPEERLALMLAEARPRVVLVRRNSAKFSAVSARNAETNPPATSFLVVAIEDLLESAPKMATPVVRHATALDPAYVSYTSGSTGRPKGVVVPHRAVARLVKGTDYVSLTRGESILHLSPLSFDASTFELWGPLLNGGRVALMPPGPPTPAEIGEAIRRHGVTTMWLTAGLFHLIVDERLDDLKPLRQLLAGGDSLSPARVIRAGQSLPGCRIINGYGPTENTTFTCSYTVEDERELTPSVPIGRPIANTRVYVLDPDLRPVSVGVAGELYAGGDGLALGYLGQPALTDERFIPNPFGDPPGSRLYRTGDRVRWRPDGNLEFLGRIDGQVKIRGFRVELEEIERALHAQPEVRGATVIVQEEQPGEKRLAAFLLPNNGEKPGPLVLRSRLSAILPEYMIPASFVWLDQMPLNLNGKVDRQALATLESRGGGAPGETSRPANLLELKLIGIWQRLFDGRKIDRLDNFFALGGHSILAARLAVELERIVGHSLPIAALFEAPTIDSLARRLQEEGWAPPWGSLVPLQPLGSKPPVFFFHGVGGDVYCHLSLARLLGPDQPCYGLQAVGLDGKTPRHRSVEEMAAHYVGEIRSFQPEGPYYLGGYSLGGVIAYEAGRQLSRLGQKIGTLALLDSGVTGPLPRTLYLRTMPAILLNSLRSNIRRWRTKTKCERRSFFRTRWAALANLLSTHRAPSRAGASPTGAGGLYPQVPWFEDYFYVVASSYRIGSYPGAVDVFVSDEADPAVFLWRHFALGGVSRRRVSGSHLDLILSPARTADLAGALTAVLRLARGKQTARDVP